MTPSLDRLVFLDESGANTNLTRLYGRAFGKERVTDHIPLNKPKNTTILSSVRLDGTVAYTTYSGGTTYISERDADSHASSVGYCHYG